MKKLWLMAILAFCQNLFAETATQHLEHYIVGSDSNYPPFQSRNGDGQLTGFEAELLTLIGSKVGFTIEMTYAPRHDWLDKLNSGAVDIFSSALGISPKRQAVAEMSDPFLSYQRAIYLLDNPENKAITTLADLHGKKMSGNQSSTSSFEKTLELTGARENVVTKNTLFLALREVWAGNVTAVLNNNRIFQYYSAKHPEFKYRLIPLDESKHYFGFAVKKGRLDLINKINRGLQMTKEDGSLNELFKKWFGIEADDF